ncbi:MAG: hypothetical protein KF832_00345 [Caldilineaceae bacterium]|nr:hypothetical protein [Caldilineaceae bacterium]
MPTSIVRRSHEGSSPLRLAGMGRAEAASNPHRRQWLAWGWRIFSWGLVLGLWIGTSQAAQAATITVTTTGDSGVGSLRQAVASAAVGDTIDFAPSLSGATIALSSGRLVLTKTLTIDAASLAAAVTLNGADTNSHFAISASASVTITGVILVNGKNNYGAAIYNAGTLTLNRVTLANNHALSGGGVYNVNTLTILNSTFSGNSAYSGGGIDNYGNLTIKNSTFANNSATNTGGALFNAGTLSFYNTILADSNSGSDCVNANEPFFNLVGVIAANVNNLSEDGSCDTALSGDPQLTALALVDGTQLHGLADDSPALDAGDNTTCLAIDQRDVPRPQGIACDIGALEIEVSLNAENSISQTSFSSVYSATPQACAQLATPGLPPHSLTPTLRNNANLTYRNLYFVVRELAYVNSQGEHLPTLCNADGGVGGAAEAQLTLPASVTGDGLLAPAESFSPVFIVGLPVRARYRIFVDLYGVRTSVIAAAPPAELLGTLQWEFDEEGNLITTPIQLFLPLIKQ